MLRCGNLVSKRLEWTLNNKLLRIIRQGGREYIESATQFFDIVSNLLPPVIFIGGFVFITKQRSETK